MSQKEFLATIEALGEPVPEKIISLVEDERSYFFDAVFYPGERYVGVLHKRRFLRKAAFDKMQLQEIAIDDENSSTLALAEVLKGAKK